MKLTSRQKLLASCNNPYWGGFSNKEEVKMAKCAARGHYWIDKQFEEYFAMSPTGRRKYIEYIVYSWATEKVKKEWIRLSKRAAKLWAKGSYKESDLICRQMIDL